MRSWTTRGVETGPQSEVVMTESAPTLLIEKLVPAPPRVVFDAWLDAEALRRFMCPAPGSSVSHVECDPRVGGKFLIMMNVGGQDLPHRGEYLEIERYTRLVFTWRSAHAGEGSRVTLQFAEARAARPRSRSSTSVYRMPRSAPAITRAGAASWRSRRRCWPRARLGGKRARGDRDVCHLGPGTLCSPGVGSAGSDPGLFLRRRQPRL